MDRPETPQIPLSHSPVGGQAIVHSTRLGPDDREILHAMGLVDRCQLRVCKQGEPCIVQVGGTRMGLSRAVAENIFVQTVSMSTVS